MNFPNESRIKGHEEACMRILYFSMLVIILLLCSTMSFTKELSRKLPEAGEQGSELVGTTGSQQLSPMNIGFDYKKGWVWDSLYIYNNGEFDLHDVIIKIAMRNRPGGEITQGKVRQFKLIKKPKSGS